MRDRVIHYSLMWELISRPHRVNARKSSFCDKEAFIWDCKHHYMHSYVSHLFHIFKSVWALDLLTLHTCSFLTDWLTGSDCTGWTEWECFLYSLHIQTLWRCLHAPCRSQLCKFTMEIFVFQIASWCWQSRVPTVWLSYWVTYFPSGQHAVAIREYLLFPPKCRC